MNQDDTGNDLLYHVPTKSMKNNTRIDTALFPLLIEALLY